MVKELDKDYIINTFQDIVNKTHSSNTKKNLKIYPERINCACPICGDSTKDQYKKRGNLYFKNLMYICFNDSSCNCSLPTFLKKVGVNIDLDKKMEIYDYIDNNVVYRNTSNYNVIESLDKLPLLDDVINFFNGNIEHKITNIERIVKGSDVYNYLVKERKFKWIPDNLYQGIYNYTDKWKDPIVVSFNKTDDKIIGMQIRNLKSGDDGFNKRFYKIYDFSQIYNIMNPEEPLDEGESISYNKLSHFYNIFNISFDKEITIFEGFFDSIFFPNSIGAIGKNTDFSFLLNDTDIDVQFFFDNDKAGFSKSLEYIKKGYKVFLWNKLFSDILKHKRDKREAIKYLKNIKDLNQLAIMCKKSPYEFFNLQKYFSKDIFDTIYLNDNYLN